MIVSYFFSWFGQGLSKKKFLKRLGKLIAITTMNIILQLKISNYFSHPLPSKKKESTFAMQLSTCADKILLEHFKGTLVTYFVLFLLYKEKQKIIRDSFKDVCFSQTVHHWHSSLEIYVKAKPLLSKTPLLLFKLSFT